MSRTAGPPLSVYVHLPWCVRKCPYCDFNSHTAGDPAQKDVYLEALKRDIEREARRVNGRRVDTVFIGGGTPSLFSPDAIAAILGSLAEQLPMSNDVEITMEANPGTVERGNMRGYRDAGVNRISLGAQSFDDGMLKRLGRIHDSDDIVAAYTEARDAGFENINLDVMFALPGQTAEQAVTDVETAMQLQPEHLSHYQLTLEPNTVFSARPPAGIPDGDSAYEMQEACHAIMLKQDYRQYEVSAFARPGRECRHNLNYWTFGDYLGVGAGAHGLITNAEGCLTRSEKAANPRQYVQSMTTTGSRARFRKVRDEDLVFEFMLNVLRLRAGFYIEDFKARTGLPAERLQAPLEEAQRRGLMEAPTVGLWRPTERGYRFLNDLQAMFLPAENA